MKTQTIKKDSAIAGQFTFDVSEWPESHDEMVEKWTQECIDNQAFNAIVIASRAKAESIVTKYFIDAGKTRKEGKRVIALPVDQQSNNVVEAAYAAMTAEMSTWIPPIGTRTRLSDVDKAKRTTDKLSDEQFLGMAAARGLNIKAAK